MKAFNAKIAEEFRANNGVVGGPFDGNELLLLTTVGAKSGQPRLSPLSCKRIDGKLLIIAGYGGADVNPAWVYNLRADQRAHVELPESRSTSRRANCRSPSARDHSETHRCGFGVRAVPGEHQARDPDLRTPTCQLKELGTP